MNMQVGHEHGDEVRPDVEHQHGRTDGHTDIEELAQLGHLTAVDARARIEDSTGVTLRELLADDGKPRRQATIEAVRELANALENRNSALATDVPLLANITREWDDRYRFSADQVRWPIVRTGEREPLPIIIRSSVCRRDGYACTNCGLDMYGKQEREWLEVDHCVPWSAGGPHDSDNLRVLCRNCNQRRSNKIDLAHLRAYRPTAWWCFDCWSSENHNDKHTWGWRNGINLGQVLYVDDERVTTPPEQVYCAFCDHYSFSTHLLVGERGRRLVEACEPTQGAA